MHPIAAILDHFIIYQYSLILALAAAAGIFCFLGCSAYLRIPVHRASATAFFALFLSLILSRLVYWYGRPDSFASLSHALRATSSEHFALAGTFAGCLFSALLSGKQESIRMNLDCMSVAGCVSLALGRLGCFFTSGNRGPVMVQLTRFPWSYPVTDISGNPEYRFATFFFQATVAAVLGIFLAVIFFRQKHRPGDVAILFVLFYSASQIILDSTRYDALYLRSNGFVSMVQVLSAVGLAGVLILLCIRAAKVLGLQKWMIPVWIAFAALFGGVGYMEYYVQRHGREAAFSYAIMGSCLACMVALGMILWHHSRVSVNAKTKYPV